MKQGNFEAEREKRDTHKCFKVSPGRSKVDFELELYLWYPSDFTTLSISSYVMKRRRWASL